MGEKNENIFFKKWEKIDKKIRIIEVFYAGTHEWQVDHLHFIIMTSNMSMVVVLEMCKFCKKLGCQEARAVYSRTLFPSNSNHTKQNL